MYGTCYKLLEFFCRNPRFAITEFHECSQNFPQSVCTRSADWPRERTNYGTLFSVISHRRRDRFHPPGESGLATVHDMENLTFPRNSVVVPRGTTRIFRTGAAELPHGRARIFRAGGHGSSTQTGTNLPCGFSWKMAETRRRTSCATTLKDRETRRKDRPKYHYRNRTCYLFRTESADCPCGIR